VFELRDDQNRRVSKIQFSVAGQGATSRSLERNAELQVKLDRERYNSGEDISVSITAPYAGNGLITIERDRVYAQQWFQTASASSIQHIRVPANFEGSGYVNVAFVRALDSKEVFVSPLSYGVVPFTANQDKRRLNVELDSPTKCKPGEKLRIGYRTDRPSRIAIFAVDEGILQVTDFKTPDPLGFFFRKCALRVETAQIMDLIIPEFSLLRSVSAYGGGGDIQHLNPFKRVTEKPVVFWSGIVDAGPDRREIIYDAPDYFDGTLKIMAVAVTDDTVGSSERETLVRGAFVITPSVPVLAAPGDEFESEEPTGQIAQAEEAASSVRARRDTIDEKRDAGWQQQQAPEQAARPPRPTEAAPMPAAPAKTVRLGAPRSEAPPALGGGGYPQAPEELRAQLAPAKPQQLRKKAPMLWLVLLALLAAIAFLVWWLAR
jgi:uncharacterized protein YfaS (alpha-2-macroglobulin family)